MASCVVGERAMVGMGAVVGEGTVVKDGGCIAAGAVTEPGTVVEANWLWSGRPARPSRELSEKNREDFARIAAIYIGYARNYLKGVAHAA
jgi:carbonic anhydrase/acetyltransferase-like protein (isoleucine patch superfamily)